MITDTELDVIHNIWNIPSSKEDVRYTRYLILKEKLPHLPEIFFTLVQLIYDFNVCVTIFRNYDYIQELIDNISLVFKNDAFMLLCKVANDESEIDISSISFVESGGSSFVYIEGDYAYQVYQKAFKHVIDICKEIQSRLSQRKEVSLLIDEERNITVNIKTQENIIPMIEAHTDLRYVKWLKLNPFTDIPISREKIRKIIWDIGKALYSLHSVGVHHGDSTLDNVGERDGRYVLFDFNLSDFQLTREQKIQDYNLFFTSVKDRMRIDMSNFPKNDSFLTKYILSVAEEMKTTPFDSYLYLSNLRI